MQLHRIDPKVPVAESVGELKLLQDEGKIRHIGLSEVNVAELQEAQQTAEIVSVQNLYNLVNRKAEDLLDHCEAQGIAFIPWFPLATGKLAGSGGPLDEIASELGASPSQLALAWLLRRSPVMLPSPARPASRTSRTTSRPPQIELTDEQFEALSRRDRLRAPWQHARPPGSCSERASLPAFLLDLFRRRHDPDVGLGRLPLAEQLLGLVVGDRAGDDHVVALLPLRRRRDLVVRGQLQ